MTAPRPQALRRGADHVLIRGASLELLAATAARVADATRRRRAAEASLSAAGVSLDALGTSAAMRAVGQQIVALAQSDRTTVLIQGEAGVGKAWIARLIHDLGARAREPFLEAWCAGT
jgi:two-component system response regulator PilR (NtrC family)